MNLLPCCRCTLIFGLSAQLLMQVAGGQEANLESYLQDLHAIRNIGKGGVVRLPAGTPVSTDGLTVSYPAGTAVRVTAPLSSEFGSPLTFLGWAPTDYDAATGFAAAVTSNPLNITLTGNRTLVGFSGFPYATVLGTTGQTWTSGGHALWTGNYDVFNPSGGGNVRGTSLRAVGEESFLETTLTGPRLMTFYWRLDVASGAAARLQLLLDGTQQSELTGDSAGWRAARISLTASAPVKVRFRLSRQTSSPLFTNPLNHESAYLGAFASGTLAAPARFRLTAMLESGVELQWDPAFAAANYTVRLSTTPDFAPPLAGEFTTATGVQVASFAGLAAGTTYYASVQANYVDAPPLTSGVISFVHGTAAPQTITFTGIPDRVYVPGGTAANRISLVSLPALATSSSYLNVSYSVVSGPATISGNNLTVTGPGQITVRASQAGSSVYAPATPVERTFTATSGAVAAFQNYLNAAAVPSTARGPQDDPDGDGIGNLLEFALGLNAASADAPALVSSAAGQLNFTYRRAQAAYVTYTVKASTDLTSWSAAEITQGTPSANGTTVATIATGASPKYVRLEVSLNP